ncbi:MAG TPA: alkaline phosphatase D family protein [Steroidobacteraceae bacterium]|nr:alkaline phosphatase D family protein [Steroidobacteraceae bacterium]
MNRRQLLERSLALAGSAALGGIGVRPRVTSAATNAVSGSDPHPALGRRLSRIGFGSCAEAGKPQPVWDPIHAREPDLFVFLGDNIYADTRDIAVMKAKYAELAAQPGFARLRASTPVAAMWDDHDFGENDAGGEYPMKDASRRIFLDFWNEPADSPRRDRDGVYAAYVFGPPGERVQLILPDLRYNRTTMTPLELGGTAYDAWAEKRVAAGLPLPGPYARNPDPRATMLGERQWQWLERQFEVPAEVRLFGSSIQVLADFTGWEAWANFARDQDRLFDVIRRKRANGVLFLSGDIHYAELSKREVNLPYPMWDLTSSGLTEEWRVPTPNANRASEVVADANFGYVDIDWKGPATTLALGIVDATGRTRMSWSLPLASLQVAA